MLSVSVEVIFCDTLEIRSGHITTANLNINNGTLNINGSATLTVANYDISIRGSSLSSAFLGDKAYADWEQSDMQALGNNLGNINSGRLVLTGNATIKGAGQVTVLGEADFGENNAANLTVDNATVGISKVRISGNGADYTGNLSNSLLLELKDAEDFERGFAAADVTGIADNDSITVRNEGKLSLQYNQTNLDAKVTLNDGALAINDKVADTVVMRVLDLKGQGGVIQGKAEITQLNFTDSAERMGLSVRGTDTVVSISSANNVGIKDYASSHFNVTGGATLNLDVDNSTINGSFSVADEGILNISGQRTVFGLQAAVAGNGGNINISGSGLTFRSAVGLSSGGGSLTVNGSGDGINFLSQVSSAQGWWADIFTDSTSYFNRDITPGTLEQDGAELTAGNYNGSINLAGKVYFGHNFISTGTTTIQHGTDTPTEVVFSEKVAVAGGTFTVAASNTTEVTFLGTTYISAVYNSSRSTQFNIKGGNVIFEDSVYNWVRSWRGDKSWIDSRNNTYIVNIGENVPPPNWSTDNIFNNVVTTGDFVYANYDVSETTSNITYHYRWVLKTDRNNTSSVNISSGNVEFKGAYYNNGSFGDTKTTISGTANVEFKSDVYNVSYLTQGITNDSEGSWSSDSLRWNSEVSKLLGSGWSNPLTADGQLLGSGSTGPRGSQAVSSIGYDAGARFSVAGDAIVTIEGNILNAGNGTSNSYLYGTHANTGFYVSGNNGIYKATLDNQGYLNISGTNNKFTIIDNNGIADFSGSNAFGVVNNRGDLTVSHIGTSTISLVNYGNFQFTGVTDETDPKSGLRFDNFDIRGGKVLMAAYVGDAGYIGDVDVSSGAEVFFTVGNTIGDINNAGTLYISQESDTDSRHFVVEGNVTNTSLMEVSGMTEFKGAILNDRSGSFNSVYAGLSYDNGFVNAGTLYVARTAAFASLINRGTASFAARSSRDMGASHSVIHNLENSGTFNANGDNLVFADSLINSGTFNLTGSAYSFRNMVQDNGTITFINAGTFNLSGANEANSFIDVDNRKEIVVEGNIAAGFGKVINRGTITMVQGLETLNFNGSLEHTGTIKGSGDVNFNYITSGNGKLEMDSSSVVTYDYDETAVSLDESGFYRVGGEIVYYYNEQGILTALGTYTERPHFSAEHNAWILDGEVISTLSAEYTPYVQGEYWYVGGQKTDAPAQVYEKALTTDEKGNWMWGENTLYRADGETVVNNVIASNFFGGSVVNLNVRGDAELEDGTKGISLISGLTLNVNGLFNSDESVRTVINNGAVLNVNHSYNDVATSSMQIDNGGQVNFNFINVNQDPINTAVVNGAVTNNGLITLGDNRILEFTQATSGTGSIEVGSGTTVSYQGANGILFNGDYNKLKIGADNTLATTSTVSSIEFNNVATLTVKGDNVVLNLMDEVIGGTNANFRFTEGGSGVFNSTTEYTMGSVTVDESAVGVNFNGSLGNTVTVGAVTNNSVVTATGYNAFGDVENNASFSAQGETAFNYLNNSEKAVFTANGSNAFGDISNAGTFSAAGSQNLVSGTLTNSGTFNVTGEENAFAYVNNEGIFTVNGGNNTISNTVYNSATGTFTVAGEENALAGIENSGNFAVSGENNIVSNAVYNDGKFAVEGVNNEFSGVISNSATGTFTVTGEENALAYIDNNGKFAVSGENNTFSNVIHNSGTFAVSGSSSFNIVENYEDSVFNVNGENNEFVGIYNEGTFTVNSENNTAVSDWIENHGKFTADSETIEANYIVNNGTFTVSGSSSFSYIGNDVDGVFTLNGENNTVSGSVINDGEFNVNGASTFTYIDNYGVFNVNNANVTLGTIELDDDSVLNLNESMTFNGTVNTLVAWDDETGAVINLAAGKTLTIAQSGDFNALFNIAESAVMSVELPSGGAWFWGIDVAKGATLSISGRSIATEANLTTAPDVMIGINAEHDFYAGSGLTLNGNLILNSGVLRVYDYTAKNNGTLADSAEITVATGAGIHFYGDAATHGKVYTASGIIHTSAGAVVSEAGLFEAGDRMSNVTVEKWIIIDTNKNYNAGTYNANAKFWVVNNAVFTIDGANAVMNTLRVDDNSSVVISGNATITDDLTVFADTDAKEEAFTVKGSAAFNGAVNLGDDLVLAGNANVTFGENSVLNAAEGVEVKGNAGTVVYNFSDAEILAGSYNNITFNGSNISAADITIAGIISGYGSVSFNGTTAGNAKVSGTELSATYSNKAQTVYGTADGEAEGTYKNLTLIGSHTINSETEAANLTLVKHEGALNTLTVGQNVRLEIGSAGGIADGVINALEGSSVEYEADSAEEVAIFNGTYYNLILENAATTYHAGSITVNNGLAGDAKVVKIDNLDSASQGFAYGINAEYTEQADNMLAGIYNNLTVSTAGTMNILYGDLIVDGNLHINSAAMDGNSTVVINGTTSGNGTFGTAEKAYAANVIYNSSNTAVFSGNYNTVTFNGNGLTADDITVNNTIQGSGSVTFNGTTAGKAQILGETLSATYGTDAAVVYGTAEDSSYKSLTLIGDHTVDRDVEAEKVTLVRNNGALSTLTVAQDTRLEIGVSAGIADGVINGVAGSTVVYDAVSADDVAIFNGRYYNIELENAATSYAVANISVDNAIYGDAKVLKIDNIDTAAKGLVDGANIEYTATANAMIGGTYGNLTISTAGVMNVVADSVTVKGALNIGSATMMGAADWAIYGATGGNGIFGSPEQYYEGTVTYNGVNQMIFKGYYTNLTVGAEATGKLTASGDITISGDAFDLSANAQLNITGSTVTYNGNGTQNVMGGTYDKLVLTGSGVKLMAAETFSVNSFVAGGTSYRDMLTLTSASAPAKWTLDADSTSINYAYVDYANAGSHVFLNGTNLTGNHNSDNWAVFMSNGGVGDSYPAINNPNFQAIVPHLLALDEYWNGTGRFDAFRRLPVATQPIAVGDMSAPMVLDAAAGYDMIDFDGEFFGDGIGILDEEASDVLNDAASADNGDLKALLEK